MTVYTLILMILAVFLVWRVYKRVQGMMVSQRSIMSRHYTGVVVFTGMVLVGVSETVNRPVILTALLAATAIGIGWGVYAVKRTRFDDETQFYTPPATIGMVIAMLFFARVMGLGIEYYMAQGPGNMALRFTDSVVTMAAVGLFGGYFGTYSAALVRWRLALRRRILRS